LAKRAKLEAHEAKANNFNNNDGLKALFSVIAALFSGIQVTYDHSHTESYEQYLDYPI
jgi:hypothetical protein